MHNKFYIFDGKTVWTGSMNITENGVYRNNNNAIVIDSEALAANYTTEFEEMFNGEFGPTSTANTPNPRVQIGDTMIENYFSPEDDPLARMLEVTATASQSIHFMAFSYTDYDLAKVMMDRMDAGVEVSGIFETRGANTEYSECPTLLEHGADVRLDANPRTFHHKVVIVDGKIVMTGSFNYSTNATESNDENVLIIYNEDIARLYEQEFAKQFAVSNEPAGGECLTADE
jgi:phosphatidylserine/phosphatidylglycerophosphate/cardiolipin synthase-like enzyme